MILNLNLANWLSPPKTASNVNSLSKTHVRLFALLNLLTLQDLTPLSVENTFTRFVKISEEISLDEFPEVVKDADLILSVPETGDDSAMGVHEASGIRWERASRRHRYVTERAFILLNNERYSTIDRKVNILGSKVTGKRVIITEDSIVRGDTTKVIIEKLRKSGAKKVYMSVTFPRIIGPCFYGIDMSTYGQLIGSNHNDEEIAKIIGADKVCYQSIENLVKATGCTKDELCMACITGQYPTPLAQEFADKMKKKFSEGYQEKNRIYETVSEAQGVQW